MRVRSEKYRFLLLQKSHGSKIDPLVFLKINELKITFLKNKVIVLVQSNSF